MRVFFGVVLLIGAVAGTVLLGFLALVSVYLETSVDPDLLSASDITFTLGFYGILAGAMLLGGVLLVRHGRPRNDKSEPRLQVKREGGSSRRYDSGATD